MSPPAATPDEAREANLVAARIIELRLDPVQGRFDTAHLREVHRRIFQDLPQHAPGEFRADATGHFKTRALEAARIQYEVAYPRGGEVPARLAKALDAGPVVASLRGLDKEQFAARMETLYGDLDYAHPFREGNSRTLREFTREIAEAAGHRLDWAKLGDSTKARELLYLARDREVFKRAYPGIDQDGFMPKDRTQHEAEQIVKSAGRAYPTLARVLATVYQERPQPQQSAAIGAASDKAPDIDLDR